MKKMLKINGEKVETRGLFAFDGCHKFYLIEDEADEREARKMDYTLLPIAEIERTWLGACPLKFISNWKLTRQFVEQGAEEEDERGHYKPTTFEVM